MKTKYIKKMYLLILFVLSITFTHYLNAKVIDLSNNAAVNVKAIFKNANSGKTIYGKKWRDVLIEHRMVVNFIPNTAEFHFNEILSYDTDYTTATSTTMTVTKGFEAGYSISTSESVTVAGETTIGVGAEIPGLKLSTSKKLQTSYNETTTEEFSSSYSKSLSILWSYDANTLQLPPNSSYCIGTVGNYITFEAEIHEEEYWWWNTTYRYNYKTVTVKIIVFKYQTAIYSNGDFYSKTDRYYNL